MHGVFSPSFARPGQPSVRRAFTLIELLVVIAIVAVLLSILLPSLSKAREAARRVICASNQRQIAIAMTTYANANKEMIPREGNVDPVRPQWNRVYLSWAVALRPYLDQRVDPAKDPNDIFKTADYYRDPARKPDDHPIHYAVNSFAFIEEGIVDLKGRESDTGYQWRRGITPMSKIKFPEMTLYLSEFGDDKTGYVISISRGQEYTDQGQSQVYDVWDPAFLDENSPKLRIGLRRHGTNANAMFFDSHVASLKPDVLSDVNTWDDRDYGSRRGWFFDQALDQEP
jgi:prepilin-type N-terminal cleavage/methylation domain-containing protein/prepilin-type processing-associated H-X9-DG protein